MSLRRITISVPQAVVDKAARAVESGDAESVSAYFASLAAREPDWAAARTVLDEMIEEAGGLSSDDIRWAREMLGIDDAGAGVA
jgi:hypothetical protein